MVFLTLKWIKAIRAHVDIEIKDNVLYFEFPVKNLFHTKDFVLSISNLINTSEDNDQGYDFIYFETKNTPYSKFYLMATEGEKEFIELKEFLSKSVDEYNTNKPLATPITHLSIYQKWPMKIVALLFLMCWFIFPIILYYQKATWIINLKYWIFVILSAGIIYRVYKENFRIKS